MNTVPLTSSARSSSDRASTAIAPSAGRSVWRVLCQSLHRRLSFATGLAASFAGVAFAQSTPPDNAPLEEIVVTAKRLDTARDAISPSLGASDYVIDRQAIANTPQGADSGFNQVLLQAPGTSQDSFGQLHIRNEHANLQYRINGIILPEGISGFGQALDTRFADSIDLITGTLPAQYGYRTAGVVDIKTKSGAFDQGATSASVRRQPRHLRAVVRGQRIVGQFQLLCVGQLHRE